MKCFPGSQFSHLFNDSTRFDVLPCWLSGLESACNSGAAGDAGLIPESGRYSGGGYNNPLQYSCLENPHGRRSLVGYSPWGLQRVGHDRATKHNTAQTE